MHGHTVDNPLRRCDGVTKSARTCKRKATVEYHLRDGSTRAYCKPHDGGAGVMSMLLPYPWEIETRPGFADDGEDLSYWEMEQDGQFRP